MKKKICLIAQKKLEYFTEVVVVDSSSTDRTKEIAEEGDAIYLSFIWDGVFPKKRNWVLEDYTFKTRWVLFIDADEFITDEFKKSLTKELVDSTKAGYWLTYNNYFQGKLMKYGVPMRKLALMKVGAGAYEKNEESRWSILDMEIHEHPILKGEVGVLHAPIGHCDYKGLFHYLSRHNEYSSWEAQRFLELEKCRNSRGLTQRQLWKHNYLEAVWWAPLYFVMNYFLKLGFLDGKLGLRFSIFKAIYFMK